MKRLRMIGLALAAAFWAGQANADQLTGTLKKVRETGVITIGYRDSSIPFSYLDDTRSRSALRSISVTKSSMPLRTSSSSTSSRSNSIR